MSDGEALPHPLFGMLPLYRAVESFEIFHVRIEISGGMEDRADAYYLSLIVEVAKDYWHPRLQGDVIEPAAPYRRVFPGAFRGKGEDEFFSVLKHLYGAVYGSMACESIYRYAAHGAHYYTQREIEGLFFCKEGDIHPQDKARGYSVDRIPTTGMRGTDGDILFERWEFAFYFPAAEPKDKAGD